MRTHSSPESPGLVINNTAFSCPMQANVNGPDSSPGEKRGLQNHQKAGDVASKDIRFPSKICGTIPQHTARVYKQACVSSLAPTPRGFPVVYLFVFPPSSLSNYHISLTCKRRLPD